uniref:Uncharacterized protein n=1 Tax=Glossina austeni TaxID=7395 RepID=A0A1A9VQP6_GLOAU
MLRKGIVERLLTRIAYNATNLTFVKNGLRPFFNLAMAKVNCPAKDNNTQSTDKQHKEVNLFNDNINKYFCILRLLYCTFAQEEPKRDIINSIVIRTKTENIRGKAEDYITLASDFTIPHLFSTYKQYLLHGTLVLLHFLIFVGFFNNRQLGMRRSRRQVDYHYRPHLRLPLSLWSSNLFIVVIKSLAHEKIRVCVFAPMFTNN